MVAERETSCGAAARIKPKVRLCEPWVMGWLNLESRGAATETSSPGPLLPVIAVAPSGLDHKVGLTQGSQSLALGLTLAAAPQLVECSRLVSRACHEIRRVVN